MFQGAMVALVTPLDENDEVDYKSLDKLIDYQIDNGVNGLVVVGTTGESATLTLEEKDNIIRHTVKKVKGRVPVVAGSGSQGTKQTLALTQMVKKAGADGALIMTPAYIKPTEEGLYQHYRTISEEVDIPIILYNVPGRTACDMSVPLITRLAEHNNIVAIKEASGSLKKSQAILECCGDKLTVLSGEDALTYDLMALGAKGVISVTCNVHPQALSRLCAYMAKGDKKAALELDTQLKPLHEHLFIESNPIPCKWALARMGLSQPYLRLPLCPLSQNNQAKLEKTLAQLALI